MEGFESAFQAFVAAGGLDLTTCRHENYDRERMGMRADPDKCKHGVSKLICSDCNRQVYQGPYFPPQKS